MKLLIFSVLIAFTLTNEPSGKEGVQEGMLGTSVNMYVNIPKQLPYPINPPYIPDLNLMFNVTL